LTWKLFGDWRGLLQGPWAGSMQNMHPQLGAAVKDHSIFFTERIPRLFRSLYPIGGVVFDGDRAPATGAEVRDYHIPIKGVDDQGRRYSALNPDVFYWAHATFFMGTIRTAEHFGDGLTEEDKRQLFDEHITWYAMYGMSMRPVPESWEAFQVYWDGMCRDVLENNWAAREVLDLSTMPKPPTAQWIPTWLWSIYLKIIGPFVVWLTVGLYDKPVRELMGYPWSARDARLHLLFGRAVKTWSSSSCRGGDGCIRGRGPAGTAPKAVLPRTRRCRKRRRDTCLRARSGGRGFITSVRRMCQRHRREAEENAIDARACPH